MKIPTLTLFATVALGLGLSAVPAQAQQVYKWKDAKGVTHYSQTPPKGRRFQQQTVNARPATPAPTTTANPPAGSATAVAAARNAAACESSRRNLGLLQGEGAVQMDSNGDGQPDTTLDAAARARQITLAQAYIDANCKAAQ